LNFSLTEQHDKPGPRADDSLCMSLTESKKELSLTDSVPILSAPPRRGAAAVGVGAAGAAGAAAAAQGGGGAARGARGRSESPNSSGNSFDAADSDGEAEGERPKGGNSLTRASGNLGSDSDILDSLARGEVVGPKRL